jgi:hypothetical protein
MVIAFDIPACIVATTNKLMNIKYCSINCNIQQRYAAHLQAIAL